MIPATVIDDIRGKDIFLVGGGNSLPKELLGQLPVDQVIALNSSVYYFEKCLAILFMDAEWYDTNSKKMNSVDIKYKFFIQRNDPKRSECIWVERMGNKCDYENDTPHIHQIKGKNVGCSALHLLDKIGANNVYLLGFDCKTINNKSHSHNHYSFNLNDNVYIRNFLPCFARLAKSLKNINVFNCSNNTNLKEFPYRNINSILLELEES